MGMNGGALSKYVEHRAEEGTFYLGKRPKQQHLVSRALPCSGRSDLHTFWRLYFPDSSVFY